MTGLETVLEYLTNVPAWYLSTTDADNPEQPHVRPFSFAAIEDGKLWFSTSVDKDVYRELCANPHFEACSWWVGCGWLILSGTVDMTDTASERVRQEGFEHMLSIGEHHDSPNDGRLTFFSLASATARIDNIDGSREWIEL